MSKQSEPETGPTAVEAMPDFPRCLKPLPLCICDNITRIDNRVSLLILQHPQEQDRAVCTENHIRVYQVTESAKLAQW
jgi:DTW domain-containing protein